MSHSHSVITDRFRGSWPVYRVAPNLDILFAGGHTDRSNGYSRDPLFEDLFTRMKETFAYTIIDCPPVLGPRGNISIPSMADSVIFVLEAERVRWEIAADAKGLLEQAGANMLGAVLNKRQYPIPEFIYRRL